MSITFSIDCDCTRPRSVCPFCQSVMYGSCCRAFMEADDDLYWTLRDAETCQHDELRVNVSETNGRDIITALGFDYDGMCNTVSVSDMQGRALLRTALAADEPVPTVAEGNIINCGREEGYIADRCAEISRLVDMAIAEGIPTLSWG